MGLLTSEAMILDAIDLQESDRIVTLLSREHGKVRGVAKGARRKYSRFAGQLQPLTKVRATWFEKEGRDLARISSIELIRAPGKVFEDLEGILLGAYLAGHMLEFAQEHEDSDHLFRLLDSTVVALERGVSADLAARYFESWVLRLAGVFPAPWECPACGSDLMAKGAALSAGSEALVCLECAGMPDGLAPPSRVSDQALIFLRRIGSQRLEEIDRDPPSSQTLAEVEDVAGRVRRSFLQHELKSYRVLRETLRDLPAEGP